MTDRLNRKDLSEGERDLLQELRRRGWGITPPQQYRSDFTPEFWKIWEQVQPYTMTSPERGWALYQALQHLCDRGIPGAVVECGVWKGGSSLLAALTLLDRRQTERDLFLYDTFTGMPEPGEEDVIAFTGEDVRRRWKQNPGWWAVQREDVQGLMEGSGYPRERLHIVPGDVMETLEAPPSGYPEAPREGQIALLRLDTDWYASTLKELEVLYPRLLPGGILIIDDYGHFEGARRAVDEYFSRLENPPLLCRADYTGRTAVKPSL